MSHPLDQLNQAQLLTLRSEIDRRLGLGLKNINLLNELTAQLLIAKNYQEDVLSNTDGVSPNQVASVLSQVASILGQLTKMQDEVYGTERIKLLEAVLDEMLRDLDSESRENILYRVADRTGTDFELSQ